jgi:hypothetical protein
LVGGSIPSRPTISSPLNPAFFCRSPQTSSRANLAERRLYTCVKATLAGTILGTVLATRTPSDLGIPQIDCSRNDDPHKKRRLIKRVASILGGLSKGNVYQVVLPPTVAPCATVTAGAAMAARATSPPPATLAQLSTLEPVATNKSDEDDEITKQSSSKRQFVTVQSPPEENHKGEDALREKQSCSNQHFESIRDIYSRITPNNWNQSDSESYEENAIGKIPIEKVISAMETVARRTPAKVNSFSTSSKRYLPAQSSQPGLAEKAVGKDCPTPYSARSYLAPASGRGSQRATSSYSIATRSGPRTRTKTGRQSTSFAWARKAKLSSTGMSGRSYQNSLPICLRFCIAGPWWGLSRLVITLSIPAVAGDSAVPALKPFCHTVRWSVPNGVAGQKGGCYHAAEAVAVDKTTSRLFIPGQQARSW